MTDVAVAQGGVGVAAIWSRTTAAIGRRPISLAALGAAQHLVWVLPAPLVSLVAHEARPDWLGGLALGMAMFASTALTIVFLRVAGEAVDDRRGDAWALRSSLIGWTFALLLLSLVTTLGIFVGLILFVIPAILLMIRWWLAPIVMIAEERMPLDAMGRSALLMTRAPWTLAVAAVAAMAPSLIGIALSGATRFVDISDVARILNLPITSIGFAVWSFVGLVFATAAHRVVVERIAVTHP